MRHLSVIVLAVLSTLISVATAAERPPNIILLLTDDQRWDTLGCMGNPVIKTPNVDKLASAGVAFDNMFVTTSICWVNRATIFTGKYGSRHKQWSGKDPVDMSQSYLALLHQAGYRTGFIGKWGIGGKSAGLLDYDKGFPGQGKYFGQYPGDDRHLTIIQGDQAEEFLAGCKADQPFCLQLSFKACHVQDSKDPNFDQFPVEPDLKGMYDSCTIPLAPTASDKKYYEQLPPFLKESENIIRAKLLYTTPEKQQESLRKYYTLITGADRVVGRIVAKLQQIGAADNTIIIYTGDNGWYDGEYGFCHKWYAHEPSLRVPLVIYDPRVPGSVKGQHRKESVLSLDLPETILDYAGIPIPGVMQGRSLKPLIRGEQVADWRTEFFYEHLCPIPTIPKSQAWRTEQWKYIRWVDHPEFEELYDLVNDPYETTNLYKNPKYATILAELRDKTTKGAEAVK
jgi:arylsulfatase A-like enzyme